MLNPHKSPLILNQNYPHFNDEKYDIPRGWLSCSGHRSKRYHLVKVSHYLPGLTLQSQDRDFPVFPPNSLAFRSRSETRFLLRPVSASCPSGAWHPGGPVPCWPGPVDSPMSGHAQKSHADPLLTQTS